MKLKMSLVTYSALLILSAVSFKASYLQSTEGHIQVSELKASTMSQVRTNLPPRGKMSAYAFFVQACRQENPDRDIVFAEFSKSCSDKWKAFTDEEKKVYQEMAEKETERYELEMLAYTAAVEEIKKKTPKVAMTDVRPSEVTSAYGFFVNSCLQKNTDEDLVPKEFSITCCEKWQALSDEEKSPFIEMGKKDIERFESEMSAYTTSLQEKGLTLSDVECDTDEEEP